MKKNFMAMWLCCIVLLLCGATAVAQTITASIRGTVTDPSGAVVAGANVTATNVATGVATDTVTNSSGLYNFQFLVLGNYTIAATASGFNSTSIGPFHLQIDQIAQVNPKLSVGTSSTTVKVSSATGAILNTENATLGTSISAHALESMPLPGQNVLYATMFVPGALNPTVGSMGSAYLHSASPWDQVPSFNGNRQQGNNFVLDGVLINETTQNTSGYTPSPQSLQEVRVITGNADAEYGSVNGAEVLYVTKAGTNQFHGSAYEYFENQNFAANSWGNNYNRAPKGKYHQHLFGGAVGGPIFKNKLFFFADYQGLRYSSFTLGLASVATDDERIGNFQEVLADDGNTINDTSNGLLAETPYPNNTIPAVVNPVANYLFSTAGQAYYPRANRLPTGGVNKNNYGNNVTNSNIDNQGDGRLDYTLSSHDTLMVKGTYGDGYDYPSNTIIPVVFPLKHEYPFAMGVIDWIHTFSPSFVNEFRAGYSRIVQDTETSDPSGNFGTHGDTLLGIGYPGTQPLPGFSYMQLYGSDTGSFGTDISAGTKTVDNNFNYTDDVTWVHGRHITRAGAQFARNQENYVAPSNIGGANGNLAYFADYTANYGYYNGGAYSAGDGLADFELDKAEVASVAEVQGAFGARQWRNAFYVQDDWKVLPNVTLNLGLRYAYDQPMYEAHDKMSSINLKAAYFAPPQTGGIPDPTPYLELAGKPKADGSGRNSRALVNPYYYQFMPRVSFAAQLNPRMVLSGGYSITDDSEGTGTGLRMTQNPPFLVSVTNLQHGPGLTSDGNPISVTDGLTTGTGGTAASSQFDVWDPNFRPAAVQQFNLTTQYLLASKTSLQIAYVGQIGQHIAEPRLLNQYVSTEPTTCTPSYPTKGDPYGCSYLVAPYYAVVGGTSQIIETVSEATSNYHALQATLHQRETNGLEFTLNYTWSRAMTDSPGGYFNVDGVGAGGTFAFAQNAYDPHAEYGPSSFDVRNNFSGTVVYQLPFGHDKKYGSNWNRLTDEALGGWELSANGMFHSGFPATMIHTVTSGQSDAYLNSAQDNPNWNYAGRLNQYFPLKITGRSLTHWFGTDPSATACKPAKQGQPPLLINSLGAPCAYGSPSAGTFGDAQNYTERNPDFKNIDLSVFKGFRTVGNQYLKLRIDAFNAFNMASYEAPNSRQGSSQYGEIISSANNPRQLQISGVYTF